MKMLKTLLIILSILLLFTGSIHVLATETTDNLWAPESFIFPSKLELILSSGEEIHKNITVYIGPGHADVVKIRPIGRGYSDLGIPKEFRPLTLDLDSLDNWFSASPEVLYDVDGPLNITVTISIKLPKYLPSGTYFLTIGACCYLRKDNILWWAQNSSMIHPLEIKIQVTEGLFEKYKIVPKNYFLDYEQLEAKYRQLEEDFETLRIKYENLKQEYEGLLDLKQKYENLLEKYENCSQQFATLEQEFTTLEQKYNQLFEEHKELKNAYETANNLLHNLYRVMYLLTAITAVLIAVIIYLKRK